MNVGSRKMDIYSAKPVVALQAGTVQDVVTFRVWCAEMPLKTNIIHAILVQ